MVECNLKHQITYQMILIFLSIIVSACDVQKSQGDSREKRTEADEASLMALIQNDAEMEPSIVVLNAPEEICSDVFFRDFKGEIVQGTRICDSLSLARELKPEHIRFGVTIAGVAGTAIGKENAPEIPPEAIKEGVKIGKVTGKLKAKPKDCDKEGEKECVSNPTFIAVSEQELANKVVLGETVAGIKGEFALPPAHSVLDSEVFGFSGQDIKGGLALPAPSSVWVDAGTYGDPTSPLVPLLSYNMPPLNHVKTSDSVNGKPGTLQNCTQDGEIDCLTTSFFKAADMSKVTAGNIRSGVTIAGQIGAYPSSLYPLALASSTPDLNESTFADQVKAQADFEFWSSDGMRHVASGSDQIRAENIVSGINLFGVQGTHTAPTCHQTTKASCEADKACVWTGTTCQVNSWNLRYGVTVFGVTGTYKTNCQERARSAVYNSDTMPPGTAGTTAGTTVHWWDVIHNHNLNAATLPTAQPAGWSAENLCGQEIWVDLTADGACDSSADDCMLKDRQSGLIWSESYPTTGGAPAVTALDWSSAVAHCDGLTFGGRSDWRLPTLMELTSAYRHGIREVGYNGSGTIRPSGSTTTNNDAFISDIDGSFWSATTRASSGWAEYAMLGHGRTTSVAKSTVSTITLVCVTSNP